LEGLEILEIHRNNYSAKVRRIYSFSGGSSHQSWEAIRYGSSPIDFLASPEGELKPNALMTEEEKLVVGRFVDELIGLQVLVPAEGELRANCPLFYVEKPHDPGAYPCVADAKAGRQNALMAKDPVYLTRSEDILPRLYGGGWSTVVDVSHQIR
jgi:hypothetical protein